VESEGGGDEGADFEPAAYRGDDTQAKKERFVDAHLADAQKIADQLGVPVENIIGVSAVESGWGESRFAADGSNYFGLHYPAPYATGYLVARDGGAKVATFASYADSLRSFAVISGSLVHGVTDPSGFAAVCRTAASSGSIREPDRRNRSTSPASPQRSEDCNPWLRGEELEDAL